MAKQRRKKKLAIKRRNITKTNLPKTKVKDMGLSKIISKIDRAIEIIDRRK